jgi:hypothetical protein
MPLNSVGQPATVLQPTPQMFATHTLLSSAENNQQKTSDFPLGGVTAPGQQRCQVCMYTCPSTGQQADNDPTPGDDHTRPNIRETGGPRPHPSRRPPHPPPQGQKPQRSQPGRTTLRGGAPKYNDLNPSAFKKVQDWRNAQTGSSPTVFVKSNILSAVSHPLPSVHC